MDKVQKRKHYNNQTNFGGKKVQQSYKVERANNTVDDDIETDNKKVGAELGWNLTFLYSVLKKITFGGREMLKHSSILQQNQNINYQKGMILDKIAGLALTTFCNTERKSILSAIVVA